MYTGSVKQLILMKKIVRIRGLLIIVIMFLAIVSIFLQSEISYSLDDYVQNEYPTPPGRVDLYGILRNFVQVSCINGRHESKSFSTLSLPQEGKYESEIGEVYKKDDNYYVDVLLNGSVYKGMYRCEPSFGVGVKHTLVKNEDSVKTITLVYQNGKWASGYAKGTILATFNVECNMEKYKVIYTDSYSNAPAFFDQVYDGLCEDDATPQFWHFA